MRVGFAIFKYFPHGGIQRDLLKIVGECLKRGHEVRILAGEWQGPMLEGCDVQVLDTPALTNHQRYRRFHDAVCGYLDMNPVDLLVGMNKMPGIDVYFAGDTCYAEKALHQRGWWYRHTARYRHFSAYERAVFAPGARTRIFTIADSERAVYQTHYGTPDERFIALPPGIEKDRIAPTETAEIKADLRSEFELGEEELLLLFVGSGFRKKGLDRVLAAMHALPQELASRTHLFVLGADNSRPFERQARRLGLADRVRFLAGRDDVPRFLFSADALVLPAYDEAAGMIILEAMFAGLPSLITENCGFAHYQRSAGAGLITPLPFSQSCFNQQLETLLTSPEHEAWCQAGLAQARRQEFFQMAEVAVDHLERFAAEREVHA